MWCQIFSNLTNNSPYFTGNEGITLLLGVIVLTCVLYLGGCRKRNLPPGPIGLPVLGYYPFLGKKPEKALEELRRKYGSVISLYLGQQLVVFLNDWEAMKDAMSQSATVARPSSLFGKVPFNFGVVGVNGPEWVQARRLLSKSMKDIGLHNSRWDELIQEEATEMVERIHLERGRPIEVTGFFSEGFANNILTLVLGERLPTGHPLIKVVDESVEAIMQYTPTLGMMNFSPALSNILQILGIEPQFLLLEKAFKFAEFVSNTVDEKIRSTETQARDSFIPRFLEETNNLKTKEKTFISEDILKGNVIALIAGGSETSRTTLIWTLMAMAENPDKQQKVHEELDRVIGREGTIRWSDRFKIPYSWATLLESMRCATVVPFTAMRIATEDIQVQGYHVPKGTFITTSNWSIHNDPRYWDDPDQFIPERFLLDGGRKVNTAPESFNPFSYGKRICPGKLIAHMEVLQFFGILMQNFKIIPKEGDRVTHTTHLGLTYQARNVELRFIPR